MKVTLLSSPERLALDFQKTEKLFAAAKFAAELWTGQRSVTGLEGWPYKGCSIGDLPSWEGNAEIEIGEALVRYTTASKKGVYEFTPGSVTFKGYRGSFQKGCLLCRFTPIFQGEDKLISDLSRIDIEVFAPIGPLGLKLHYGAFNQFEVESSRGDLPLLEE
ncbi:MAG: hypothetical protein PHT51_00755 [Patescibacteria group bacterium]|nr:hypothetical protein [Patescibacteria group bacterium]MDD4610608.1 hypothetical protein [Patescibacteria group bacterium]